MSNPNEHIEEFLKHYFKLPSPPQYAVLLKGKWGVGKTWFLKEIMASLHDSDYRVKTHLYVSLYGVASFEEIGNEFFRQLHPVLSSKGMALAGKIGKGLLKTALKIDLNGDGKSDVNVSSQVPDINLPDYLSDTEDLVLVFDDLERASMDLESLLGYINYFVEHQGCKVIIIANEDELINKEKASEVSYKRIKEKLIGKTFEIQPRLDLAISNFIKEVESGSTQDLFNSNIELIKDYYLRSAYLNLRHLRQALMDFSRLIEFLPDEIKDKEGIIEQLLSIYLVLSFEIKSGEMLPDDINNFNQSYLTELMNRSSNNGMKEGVIDSPYSKVKGKYPAFDPFDMLLEKAVWIDMFDKGLIDKAKIEESLKSSRYFHSDNQSDWMKLWHFMYIADNDFDSLLTIVQERFHNKQYEELGEIKHVTGLFLELVELGLLDMTKEKIFEIAKNNIDNLITEGKEIPHFDYMDIYDDTQTFGLEFRNSKDAYFIKLLEHITEVSKKQVLNNLPEIGKELLEDIKNSTDGFHKKIYYTGSVTIYQKEPILTYIVPDDFSTSFIESEPYARRHIALVISSRYKPIPVTNVFLPELDWLRKVVSLLESEVESRKGKVSELQIRYLINEYFNPAITALDEASKLNID